MKLVAGNSNRPLADAIAAYLKLPLAKCIVRRFADMEIFVEVQENVRGEDMFVIQSTSYPANDNLMELLIMIDALRRASARRITAVIPYFGYARQDRKVGPRTPISAKLVANLITGAGANRVLTVDLHAGQIQGFFDIPTDNLYAQPVMVSDIQDYLGGRDLMIVMDLSKSMLADDMRDPELKERWQAAREGIRELLASIRQRGGHRLGLVVFAAKPWIVCPLTADYDHFALRLEEFDPIAPPREVNPLEDEQFPSGTRIGAAILEAVRAHKDRVCPLDCGKGKIADGGRCVEKHEQVQRAAPALCGCRGRRCPNFPVLSGGTGAWRGTRDCRRAQAASASQEHA